MRLDDAFSRFVKELIDLVRSELSDAKAAQMLGHKVEADPDAASSALEWLAQVCRVSTPTYETDRAYRLLAAATGHASPEPASCEHAVLFERERDLALMSQEQAFTQLASSVPELEQHRLRAQRLAEAPDSFGINIESRSVSIPPGLLPSTAPLVGPSSDNPDPLIRSHVASSVVSNYVVALMTRTTHLALWHPHAPTLAGSFSGRML
jgi:hypothetical protein